ncbi:hypothetical protein NBRC116601_07710 [Cognatishimia sp. WU-CL00825]
MEITGKSRHMVPRPKNWTRANAGLFRRQKTMDLRRFKNARGQRFLEWNCQDGRDQQVSSLLAVTLGPKSN